MNKWITALERRPLSRKLAVGFALLLLGTMFISVEGIVSQRSIVNNLKVLHDKEMMGIASGKDAQIVYATIGRTIRQVLITTDTAERELALGQLAAARVTLGKEMEGLRSTLFREETNRLFARFEENYALYLHGVDKAIALLRSG